MYILSFLSILGWTIFLSSRNHKYSAYYPFFVITSVITVLYVASLVNVLQYASWILIFSGIILPLYSVYKKELTWTSFKSMPPSFFILMILGFIWVIFTRNASIFGSDEFAWGQFAKVLVSNNALYDKNSAIMDGKLNYPPGIALYQYFFMSFNRYSEPAIFFAQGFFALASITPIFDFIGRSLKKILAFSLAIAMSLVYFGPGLLSMTNDHIIGSAFAIAIIANLFILKTNKSKLLLLPIIFVLPLIKTTGILLSLIIVLSVIIEIVFNLVRNKVSTKKIFLKSLVVLVLLGFFALLPVKSWDFYMKSQGIDATPMPTPSLILKSFSSEASEREKMVLKNFRRDLIERPINFQEGDIKSDIQIYKTYIKIIEKINRPPLGTLSWSLIFLLLMALMIYCAKEEEKVLNISRFGVLLLGLVVYTFFHLLAYMYYFSEYEALKLAAMDRYLSSYFLSLSLISIAFSAKLLKEKSDNKRIFIWAGSILLVYLMIFHTPTIVKLVVPPKMMAKSTESVRAKTRPFSEEINSKTEKDSKIWVIYQNTKGWECMMIRYDIVPRRMNGGSGNWSLGEKYAPEDVWTNEMPDETWRQQIQDEKFTYVYLAYTDDNFWSHHSGMFADSNSAKSNKLFKVEQKDGQIALIAK